MTTITKTEFKQLLLEEFGNLSEKLGLKAIEAAEYGAEYENDQLTYQHNRLNAMIVSIESIDGDIDELVKPILEEMTTNPSGCITTETYSQKFYDVMGALSMENS